jgi:hypothetical protein
MPGELLGCVLRWAAKNAKSLARHRPLATCAARRLWHSLLRAYSPFAEATVYDTSRGSGNGSARRRPLEWTAGTPRS